MKLGIPRAFMYYDHKYLWNKFFSLLGFEVVLSPKSNNLMVLEGKKYAMSEDCLAFKVFMGHVYYLSDKCDYILIPRFESFSYNNVSCVKLNSLYDTVKNIFPNLKIIDYNVDVFNKFLEKEELIKIGLRFKDNKDFVNCCYNEALEYQKNMDEVMFNKQEEILNNKKKKLLIVAHPYNVLDNYIGNPIIELLKDYDCDLLYSCYYNLDSDSYLKYSKDLYWDYNKKMLNAIDYYKDRVEGIIFLSSFPCGCDILANDLIMRKINIPHLNLIVDEHSDYGGITTRIESFMDIVYKKVCYE